jgi:hypothetical protein
VLWLLCAVSFAGVTPLRAEEFIASITRVEGGRVTFARVSDSGMAKGKGKGKGAARGGGLATTLAVAPGALITSASTERRTQEFRKGVELGGGLANPVFRNLQGGLRARLVTSGNQLTEINVFIAESETPPIAIRPKRPPSK